jgi:hypothetical protein
VLVVAVEMLAHKIPVPMVQQIEVTVDEQVVVQQVVQPPVVKAVVV